jgi:hypothetical protein
MISNEDLARQTCVALRQMFPVEHVALLIQFAYIQRHEDPPASLVISTSMMIFAALETLGGEAFAAIDRPDKEAAALVDLIFTTLWNTSDAQMHAAAYSAIEEIARLWRLSAKKPAPHFSQKKGKIQ